MLTFRGSAPKSWFLAVVLRPWMACTNANVHTVGTLDVAGWKNGAPIVVCLSLFCSVFCCVFHKKGGLGTGGIEGKRRDIYQRYTPARARHPVDDPALPSLSTSLTSLTSLPFVFFLFIFLDLIHVHSLPPVCKDDPRWAALESELYALKVNTRTVFFGVCVSARRCVTTSMLNTVQNPPPTPLQKIITFPTFKGTCIYYQCEQKNIDSYVLDLHMPTLPLNGRAVMCRRK